MDVLGAINPAAKPLERSAQMNPEEQAVCTFWEAELYLPSDFKPPNLREISNRAEPGREKKTAYFSSLLLPAKCLEHWLYNHTVETKYKQHKVCTVFKTE